MAMQGLQQIDENTYRIIGNTPDETPIGETESSMNINHIKSGNKAGYKIVPTYKEQMVGQHMKIVNR